MKIAYDATSLSRKSTGIESYSLNLLKALLRQNTSYEFLVLFRRNIPFEFVHYTGRARFLVSPLGNQVLCEQVWIPYILRAERVDLSHFPAFPPGLAVRPPFVINMYDATIWKYPDTLSWKGRLYFRTLFKRACRRSSCVLTVSDSSRSDIALHAGLGMDRIVNIGVGRDEDFSEVNSGLEVIRKKYHLPEKFILSVGTLEPRKNLVSLIKAFATVRKSGMVGTPSLVLAGRKAWGWTQLKTEIRHSEFSRDIIILDYVPKGDLIGIYNLAEVFVCPSIYEGFGLPVLEAMACGTPVITSNLSSLPEVGGDAVMYTNPLDVEEISSSILKVLGNKMMRSEMKAKGLARARVFTWDSVAEKTIEIYENQAVRNRI